MASQPITPIREVKSKDIIDSIAERVIQDSQSQRAGLVVIGSGTYTRPRKRDGRSRTPVRCIGSDSPHSPDRRYLELGARPKIYSHEASFCPSTTLDEDNEVEDDGASVVVTKCVPPGAIDFTRGGKRLPSRFPIYTYEQNLGYDREYVNRPTPTPTPSLSPSRPGTPCESIIFCGDIASAYSESVIFCGEEKASTSKPPGANSSDQSKVEDLEILSENILGRYPTCNTQIDLSPNDLSELSVASSPETFFPTTFRRSGKRGFVAIKKSTDEEYINLIKNSVSDSNPAGPSHQSDLTLTPSAGVRPEKVVTELKQGVGCVKVHDKVHEKAHGEPHARSTAEYDAPSCSTSALRPKARAPVKVQPVYKVNDKPGKRRKSKRQRQRLREHSNVRPQGLKWWIGHYLAPGSCHKSNDPPFKVSIPCPSFHLPQHHCIDNVLITHIRDQQICGCDLFDKSLGNPATCWCVSAIREITISFEIESSCHQNSNLMDQRPDP